MPQQATILAGLVLLIVLTACNNSSQETRELLPEPDKDLREKYEKQQDSLSKQPGTKIPTH